MKKFLKIILTVLVLVCCIQFSSTVSAASKPKATVKLGDVEQGKLKASVDGNKLNLSVKAKNKSKGTVRKMNVSYKIVLKGTKTVKVKVPVEIDAPETTTAVQEEPTTVAVQEESTEVETTSDQKTKIMIKYEYETSKVTVKKTVTVTFKSGEIKSGKTATLKAKIKNPLSGAKGIKVASAKVNKKQVYSSTGLWTYTAKNKKKLTWGVKDKKAPVITGLIEEKSYQGDDCYITVFSDEKDFRYSKYIKATDNRDGKVKINVDTEKVNWKKRGNYKVKVTAKDKAGNVAKSWLKIHVEPKGMLSEMADDILSKIISKSWSDEKKCRTIYTYVQGNISYVDSNARVSWQSAAEQSVKYRYGNCFNYYALSKLLISRCQIPNLEITRYPASYGNHHWWNLVYVNGGWYHFDTTPRIKRGYLCLLTDAQLQDYCRRTGNTMYYNNSLYPARSSKTL